MTPSSNPVTPAILRVSHGGTVMPTKIQRWGNSQGLRIPKEVLVAAKLGVGDAVDVRAVDGTLIVTPLRRVRGRLALSDLVAAMPTRVANTEVPWGEPEGDEI